MVNAREQPFTERDVHPGRFHVTGPAHTETDVLPHLWLDVPEPGAPTLREVWMYRVLRRNGFTVNVECAADAWPKVRTACLRAAQSLATTMDEWPAPPAGYARRVHDGIVYYVQPEAGESDAAVHAVVNAERQAFVKMHGAVSWGPESPLVVVVHARTDDSAKSSRDEQNYDAPGYRLIAVAPAKGDDASRARLVREARYALLAQTFASETPTFLFYGEPMTSWMEAMTGKPAPCVLEGFAPPHLPKFDDLAYTAGGNDARDAGFVYTAFFLCGPRLYRDAFAAFLKDVAAGGDSATAPKARLLCLDQEKLRDAAQKFADKELKPVKAK
jgi:hypothetical protein